MQRGKKKAPVVIDRGPVPKEGTGRCETMGDTANAAGGGVRFRELDVVTLAEDCPALGLRAGMRGTVVMVYGDHEAYEVEFVAPDGDTVALAEFMPEQLRASVPRTVGAKQCPHTAYQARPIFDKPGPPVAYEYACGHCGHVWKEAAA